MELLVYTSGGSSAKRLEEAVRQSVSQCCPEICRSIDTLKGALCRAVKTVRWAILLAGSMKAFEEILNLSEMMEGSKVIFIIPDRRVETIRRAHTIYPRLIAFESDDFSEVCEVIKHVEGRFLSAKRSQ